MHYVPTIFLDATADPTLLDKAWGGIDEVQTLRCEVPFPINVRFRQHMDWAVKKSSLGLYPAKKPATERQKWHDDISRELSKFDRSKSVGVVTFTDIESELKDLIEGLGFSDVKTAHYHNLRSSNEMQDVEVLLLFGRPFPPPDGFKEEVQAFFWDEEPLDLSWTTGRETYTLRSGTEVPAPYKGYYGDDRAQAYFRQKTQLEVIQALHRCRPLRMEPDQCKEIMIYTDLPLPGVPIDGFLGTWGLVIDALRSGCADDVKMRVTDVARAVESDWKSGDTVKKRTDNARKWIGDKERRRPEALALFAEVEWDGKFFRRTTTSI